MASYLNQCRAELVSVGSLSAAGVIPMIRAYGADEDQARATFAAVYGFAAIVATQPDPSLPAEISRFGTATTSSRRRPRGLRTGAGGKKNLKTLF